MDNAIKFSQSGSVLTLGVKEETLDDDRANFTFYRKDQGVGMSEDFIAHAFDEDRKKVLECGMDGFLSKPIIIEELIDTLQKNLLD